MKKADGRKHRVYSVCLQNIEWPELVVHFNRHYIIYITAHHCIHLIHFFLSLSHFTLLYSTCTDCLIMNSARGPQFLLQRGSQ